MEGVSSEYAIPVYWLTVNVVEPTKAKPLFTYTSIENEVPDYDRERVYGHTDHRLGEAPGRLAPAHRHLENHQQGRTEDRGPQSPRDLEGADKRSFEARRATPGEFDDIEPEEISKQGNWDVFAEQPIQREKSVVFKNQQQPSHYTGYNENDFRRETDDRAIEYRLRENTEKLMKEAKSEGHEHSMQIKNLTRPTYMRVNRKHLSPATLDAYNLPWEWDKVNLPIASYAAWLTIFSLRATQTTSSLSNGSRSAIS